MLNYNKKTEEEELPDTLRYFSADNTERQNQHLKPESHSSRPQVPNELSETFMNQSHSQRQSQIASLKMSVTLAGKADYLQELEGASNPEKYLGEQEESEKS